MTKWSPQQDDALMKVSRWLKDPQDKQLFRLFGYAGTGKTTLAKHLAQDVPGRVMFAAYTGKATSVLRRSGAPNAQTIHSLIYNPKERSKERLNDLKAEREEIQQMIAEDAAEARAEGYPADQYVTPKKLADRLQKVETEIRLEERSKASPDFDLKYDSDLNGAKLLVVDECSMVDETMALDIMSYGVPVLVLGDPAQLPPVKGTGYFTDARPDIMLTEIHRQARDNPIIELATRVRNNEALLLGQYGSSSVISRATPELALAADQVLVGRNATRRSTNKRMRELKGYGGSPLPLEGEKLVCLRNDKDLGLLNGTLHITTDDAHEVGGYVNLRIRPEELDETASILVPAHREHFQGDPEEIGYWDRRNAQEFTYGYALTVHKSQGSQWGNVLVIDEGDAFKKDRTRWLYTAITRAQDTVTVVRS
ncbi:ATP-dependent RecD-like DNA helicase protein [Rhizobium phage RHph_I72]|nr:ATP-dependent RecD-like DNA helicase protein [Rhizobium phage RHph_I65]QIG76515.1 ATP-dependent RecD-like DNA helicase protein [Rhizobium phage RHph_I72]